MLVWNLLTWEKITQIEEIVLKMDLEIHFTEQKRVRKLGYFIRIRKCYEF